MLFVYRKAYTFVINSDITQDKLIQEVNTDQVHEDGHPPKVIYTSAYFRACEKWSYTFTQKYIHTNESK